MPLSMIFVCTYGHGPPETYGIPICLLKMDFFPSSPCFPDGTEDGRKEGRRWEWELTEGEKATEADLTRRVSAKGTFPLRFSYSLVVMSGYFEKLTWSVSRSFQDSEDYGQ